MIYIELEVLHHLCACLSFHLRRPPETLMWPFLASLWTQLRQIDLVLGKVHEGVIFCENAKLESDDAT